MDGKEFKKLFAQIAKASGFEGAYGGWFAESHECIVVLDLQKSNFGNYFELNLKVFVQGLFGRTYVRGRAMVKKLPGNVFVRPPKEYDSVFNLDQEITREGRRELLQELFEQFIMPTTKKLKSRSGLIACKSTGLVYLLPAVEKELMSN